MQNYSFCSNNAAGSVFHINVPGVESTCFHCAKAMMQLTVQNVFLSANELITLRYLIFTL